MSKLNMKQWIDDLIENPIKKAIPILSFPAISLMDITVRELIGSHELQAQGMKAVAERTEAAAAVSMMDLSVEAEAFGAEVRFSDDEVPTVIGAIVTSEEEADALKTPAVGSGRTGRYIKAIENACGLITDRPVLAGIIGPFSLAGRLMDVSEALVNCMTDPEMVHKTMRKTTDFLIEYARAYKAAGAQGIIMAEPLTGLLSPTLAEEFSEPYVREIAQAVQNSDFIVVYHNCGDETIKMIDSILRTGCDAFHFGNSIDISEMAQHIPAHIPFMGNVDPSEQFRNGTPESIYIYTQEIMEKCARYPNFIISSGCDIPPLSPWENIDAFFKAVSDFYTNH